MANRKAGLKKTKPIKRKFYVHLQKKNELETSYAQQKNWVKKKTKMIQEEK